MSQYLTRVRHHEREVFPSDVREESEQESLGVGGGETHADLLRDGGAPRAQEVVLYYRVRTQVYTDFCET